jgi:hypothetical protein
VSSDNFNLHETEFQRIRDILSKMQSELRAQLVLLINRSGQPIVISGAADNIDCTALASLAAANLAATDGLANIVGEREFSVLVHQGRRRSLFISDLLSCYALIVNATPPSARTPWAAGPLLAIEGIARFQAP